MVTRFTGRCLRLRQLMHDHGLSVRDVAEILDFHPTYVQALRAGQFRVHRRTLRLLELEIAERARTRQTATA